VLLLIRALALVDVAMVIYSLVECIQTPQPSVRNLPKWAWILLILLFSPVGWVAWLMAGRPSVNPRHQENGLGHPENRRDGRRAPLGPDDDPDFLRELGRVNSEHEQTLQQWEADLRRREEELRRLDADPPADGRDVPPGGASKDPPDAPAAGAR
jgi:hypothetical protein